MRDHCFGSVHPMACGWHDIGCTEDQLWNASQQHYILLAVDITNFLSVHTVSRTFWPHFVNILSPQIKFLIPTGWGLCLILKGWACRPHSKLLGKRGGTAKLNACGANELWVFEQVAKNADEDEILAQYWLIHQIRHCYIIKSNLS